MTELFLEWMASYGVWLIGVTTLLSCLAVPVPASLLMLTAGGFVASGDMAGWTVVSFAFAGAVIGDQIGYTLGRTAGAAVLPRLEQKPKRAKLIRKATDALHRRGVMAVFLSRWLVSPLGPYVNLAGGASKMLWTKFSIASVGGEAVWVALYVSAGFVFADRIVEVGDLLANASGVLAAGTVTVLLWIWLRHSLRTERRNRKGAAG